MSYGSDMPWGLQATKTLNSATYNGQSSPYLIQSGYQTNIFKGDPVIITTGGYIQSLFDWAAGRAGNGAGVGGYPTGAILGVFVGCSFVTSTALNPIDPASPGRSYWPASTATLNSIPATAYVIDDPDVIYNVQTNRPIGLTQANMGLNASLAFTAGPAPFPATQTFGNFITGTSMVVINQDSIGVAANLSVKLLRMVSIAGNFADSGVPPRIGYNNAEVIIQNHVFCTRPNCDI